GAAADARDDQLLECDRNRLDREVHRHGLACRDRERAAHLIVAEQLEPQRVLPRRHVEDQVPTLIVRDLAQVRALDDHRRSGKRTVRGRVENDSLDTARLLRIYGPGAPQRQQSSRGEQAPQACTQCHVIPPGVEMGFHRERVRGSWWIPRAYGIPSRYCTAIPHLSERVTTNTVTRDGARSSWPMDALVLGSGGHCVFI